MFASNPVWDARYVKTSFTGSLAPIHLAGAAALFRSKSTCKPG